MDAITISPTTLAAIQAQLARVHAVTASPHRVKVNSKHSLIKELYHALECCQVNLVKISTQLKRARSKLDDDADTTVVETAVDIPETYKRDVDIVLHYNKLNSILHQSASVTWTQVFGYLDYQVRKSPSWWQVRVLLPDTISKSSSTEFDPPCRQIPEFVAIGASKGNRDLLRASATLWKCTVAILCHVLAKGSHLYGGNDLHVFSLLCGLVRESVVVSPLDLNQAMHEMVKLVAVVVHDYLEVCRHQAEIEAK
ncbi:hypothetical protein DIURU_001831 [Diutina rugosa]|uniref:Uncharacterized protein n=1 Tax=Diutina rugosa TaxID=5481 RepID=A0A642UUS4_DIURU|nr:uncharacterized protein DIURU_001831 [Diutina rugosa]KAA8904755.1 hypothetical protein DIURU_001831 [Diutina rugosa]